MDDHSQPVPGREPLPDPALDLDPTGEWWTEAEVMLDNVVGMLKLNEWEALRRSELAKAFRSQENGWTISAARHATNADRAAAVGKFLRRLDAKRGPVQ